MYRIAIGEVSHETDTFCPSTAMPVDAICLNLHGAGMAETLTDLESGVLTAVRQAVGPTTPIGAPWSRLFDGQVAEFSGRLGRPRQ